MQKRSPLFYLSFRSVFTITSIDFEFGLITSTYLSEVETEEDLSTLSNLRRSNICDVALVEF
ncbi:CLUMA_CG013394, isoform A [Clunio marinus]|uniref:CLUMA_CG013394, isoform A n=1 Tax=Clunio marinus TaxID=568069 RepID=A0A1J1INQ3_9DIPT|nr:CLUMA_CG013394, isoform A [Clunio marinus]